MKQELIEGEKEHDEDKTHLSKEAQDADERLEKLLYDPTLTGDEKDQKIDELWDSLPAKIRDELEKIMGDDEAA